MVREKIEMLRELLRRESLDAFIFPSTDPHNGEYVPDHWKGREWISGFNGSAGTVVITLHEAALWTDSRYFLAAAEQLDGTGIELMKDGLPGTPAIHEWLAQKLSASGGTNVGVDGMVMAASDVENLITELRGRGGITVRTNLEPLRFLWKNRPEIPLNKVELYPMEYAGESVTSKLSRIREQMKSRRCDWHLVTMLDDIAWTLNLRGTDVHCNPVFVSYLLIGMDSATLFVDDRKLTSEVHSYLSDNNIYVRAYEDIQNALGSVCRSKNGVDTGARVLLDDSTTCYSLYKTVGKNARNGASPIPVMKAVKNETEISGFRKAMIKDGVAMVKALCRLTPDSSVNGESVMKGEWTEITFDQMLTKMRAEQPGFRDISFDTIAAYGEHGAIVHYEATPETDVPLQPKGFLLLDSGAQFMEGTTDITRTIPLGPLTDEERKVYTLVLKGNIQLAMLKFPDGASGTQLDALARAAMWREGMNYGHGTGHGVGSYLNVHEGPHQIRMQWKPTPLRAGMTITDEPGLYLAGRFGVRTENTMIITPYKETEFGKFLQLEPLTLCPIATSPIVKSMMTDEEIMWLNDYHQRVRDELLPYLEEEEYREWLIKNTEKFGDL